MAPTTQCPVMLKFGGSSVNVEPLAISGRRGALRVLAREAEHHFGLLPGKYSFNALQGKVDSPEKLEEYINEEDDGVCQIEIYEHEDGRMLRETMAAMKTLEERMVKRMEEALVGIRREVQADMRHVASEQSELRARMDELSTEALESRADLLQGEQELTMRLDSLTQDCLAMREDALLGEEAMTTRVDKLIYELQRDQPEGFLSGLGADAHALDSMKQLEDLARELQDECDAMSLRELDSVEDDSETLRKQVRALNQTEMPTAESKPAIASKMEVTGSNHVRVVAPEALPKDSLMWSSKSSSSFAKPYSMKTFQVSAQADALVKSWTCEAGKLSFGSTSSYDAMTPFPHCKITPKLRGCRSSPLLPALK